MHSTEAALSGEASVLAAPEPFVLVVDDDEAMRFVVRQTLRRAGYRAMAAGDAQEALVLAERHLAGGGEIDAVVLDLKMPRMNGFEFLREIRSMLPLPGPYVVVISGAEPEELGHAMSLGADRVMNKPYDLWELVGYVQKAVPLED